MHRKNGAQSSAEVYKCFSGIHLTLCRNVHFGQGFVNNWSQLDRNISTNMWAEIQNVFAKFFIRHTFLVAAGTWKIKEFKELHMKKNMEWRRWDERLAVWYGSIALYACDEVRCLVFHSQSSKRARFHNKLFQPLDCAMVATHGTRWC